MKSIYATGFCTMATLFGATASSEEVIPRLLIPGLGSGQTVLNLKTDLKDEADLSDTPGTYRSYQFSSSGSFELHRNDNYAIFASAQAEYIDLESDINLGLTDGFPDDITRSGLSLGNEWIIDRGTTFVSKIGLSSASDKPFNSADETEIQAEAYLRLSYGKGMDGLIFGLRYGSKDKTLGGAPLPVAAYHYVPSRELSVLIGFPVLGINWRPSESPWTANLLVTGPAYNLGINYHLTKNDRITFEARNTGWDAWLAERIDENDKLSYSDHQVGLAYSRQMGKAQLSLAAGASIAREITYEENQAFWKDDNNKQSVDIDPTLYLRVGLNVSF